MSIVYNLGAFRKSGKKWSRVIHNTRNRQLADFVGFASYISNRFSADPDSPGCQDYRSSLIKRNLFLIFRSTSAMSHASVLASNIHNTSVILLKSLIELYSTWIGNDYRLFNSHTLGVKNKRRQFILHPQ